MLRSFQILAFALVSQINTHGYIQVAQQPTRTASSQTHQTVKKKSEAPKPPTASAQSVEQPSASPESALSGSFRQGAFRTCKAIERVNPLETDEAIYDSRLRDAQTAVDDLDFSAKSDAEKIVLATVKSELAKAIGYRLRLHSKELQYQVELRKLAVLSSGRPSVEQQQMRLLGEQAVGEEATAIRSEMASNHALQDLEAKLKNGDTGPYESKNETSQQAALISPDDRQANIESLHRSFPKLGFSEADWSALTVAVAADGGQRVGSNVYS